MNVDRSPVPGPRSRVPAVVAGVVVATVILLVMPWHALVGVFYDDGIYLALARSLVSGGGYHLPYLPGAPAGVHYPFAYPAFLAALWKLWPAFPDNVRLMRGANAVFMGVAAALMTAHLAARVALPRWLTALVIVLAATAVPMVAVATVLFSEPLFLVFAAAACWAADAAVSSEGGRAMKLATLAGILAGTATETRSIGVTVIGGIVLAFAVRRRWKEAAAAAIPAALLVLPWVIWSSAHHAGVDPLIASNYGTYGDLLRQNGTGFLTGQSFLEVARPLAAIALPPMPEIFRVILGLNALLVLFAGFVALTQVAPSVGWMLWCYLAIVAVWPYAPDRFIWGALPWIAVAFPLGLLQLGSTRSKIWGRTSPLSWVAACAVIIGFAIGQIRGYARGFATTTQVGISDTMNDILPWIRTATDSTAIIAGEDEALIWLYTGRRAVPSFVWRVTGRTGVSFGADSLHAWLERSGATHLILTGPGSEAAPTVDELLSRRPGYLELIRVWPGQLFAFRIHRGA